MLRFPSSGALRFFRIKTLPLRPAKRTMATEVTAFIEDFNQAYEQKHKAFEDNFWSTKMNLKGCSADELTRTKNELDRFLGDAQMLAKVQLLLQRVDLSAEQRKTLAIFERTFKCYIITDEKGVAMREELNRLEAKLAEGRRAMKLGYTNKDGQFVEASSVQLRSIMRTSEDEAVRKSCYEGMRSIGNFVAAQFIEITKLRNKLARSVGFECYYDMKVTAAEGFGKQILFPMLEKLVDRSKSIRDKALKTLAAEKGEDALKPWNMGYALAGDLSALQDPYFPFENAVNAWARSFAALNIKYSGATMRLDLCDRAGKYSNGFCHWPQPAWQSSSRGWIPSEANFTSLATPGQVGSGHTALVTLMHEGGHAAHFANVHQPSPLFSQERAPTSIPYAENQSMFLDSLVGDAAWIGRYAMNKNGEVMPWELIEREIRQLHPYKVFALTSMLAVPIFERRLYDMAEDKLTVEAMLKLADEVELEVQGVMSSRPLLSVPHPLTDESAAYYHGYVLADMAVYQTRKHFLQKYGYLVDNPKIGEDLKNIYWTPGNSRMFLDLVKEMTGEELSGDAYIEMLEQDVEELVTKERAAYQEAVTKGPKYSAGDAVDLEMRVLLVHGDEVISDSNEGGITAACQQFSKWIGANFSK
ncbi:oligoendopeptidase [Chytriomyces sp. MP71]|nr:oligoendopeptidase [Chytriomyces sp. MP71]